MTDEGGRPRVVSGGGSGGVLAFSSDREVTELVLPRV